MGLDNVYERFEAEVNYIMNNYGFHRLVAECSVCNGGTFVGCKECIFYKTCIEISNNRKQE